MVATQRQNPHEEEVASELCGDQESAIVLGRSSNRRVGSRNGVASFSTDPTSSVSSTCSPLCPSGRPLRGTRTPGTLVLEPWIPRWSCPPEENFSFQPWTKRWPAYKYCEEYLQLQEELRDWTSLQLAASGLSQDCQSKNRFVFPETRILWNP